jgi:signal transduction histidine kinase
VPEPDAESAAIEILQANVRLLADREQLERERLRLIELDRLKTEFLARVSHDLRTPLNSIIGFSELILGNVGGKMNRRHAEFISAINRNGHALQAMINDLLDLSTLDSRQMVLKAAPVPLSEILADLRAATEPVLVTAKLKVSWPEDATLVGKQAFVDRRRLLRLLVNLVDNAKKFTPPGGRVAIGMDADDTQATFTVSDTGPGIPADERERIFKPYYQRSQGPTPRGDGVGLGLVIVKAMVDLHHGTITIHSDPGKGCLFSVVLPQQSAAPPAGAP